MDTQTILANVLSPAALFFFLGFLSVLLRSDLELPYPLPKFFSTYLLISISYTGGEKLAAAGLTPQVAWTIAAAMGMALFVPFYTFFFLRRILSVYDAAAMPAAMRQAVPEANPGLFELLSLSVTFPFNISVGIPLYYGVIERLWA
jgi:hypothetical protein